MVRLRIQHTVTSDRDIEPRRSYPSHRMPNESLLKEEELLLHQVLLSALAAELGTAANIRELIQVLDRLCAMVVNAVSRANRWWWQDRELLLLAAQFAVMLPAPGLLVELELAVLGRSRNRGTVEKVFWQYVIRQAQVELSWWQGYEERWVMVGEHEELKVCGEIYREAVITHIERLAQKLLKPVGS